VRILKTIQKHFFISLSFGIATSFFMIYLYLFMPYSFHSLDDRFRDFFFILRGKQDTKAPVTIVDIDEKSIKHFGQFPWDRKLVSELINKINSYEPLVIGIDIVFSEPDKRSPSYFAKHLNLKGNFEDYDEILAETFSKTLVVLGYLFDFELEHNNSTHILTPGILRHKENTYNSNLPKAKGVVSNLQIFHDNAYSSGFFNSSPGYEHKVRKVPTAINYKKNAYLSLDMEIYRTVMGFDKTKIYYFENGDTYDIFGLELSSKETKESIRVDTNGQLYVNFRGPAYSYKYVSAYDLLSNKADSKHIKDKIILIGTSAKGLVDLRATPLDNSMPGVEVHANLIDNLLNKDYIYPPRNFQLIDILTIVFIAVAITILFSYLSPLIVSFLIVVLFAAMVAFYYILLFKYYLVLNIFYPFLTFFVSIANALLVGYFFEQKQKELIKTKFASKVSKNVMNNLLKLNTEGLFDGQEKNITIFFSDIRSFSTLSERLEPKVLIKLLNNYMSPMTDIITKYNGTIDKFIGDAIMAYWNAPQDTPNHADEAIKCALEQINEKDNLNKILKERFDITIEFGIGINTGSAIVGEMGSTDRSDYTAIGNNVNIASRLEGLCPVYGVELIFSHFTMQDLKNSYNALKIDTIRVKGIKQPIDIYTILKADRVYMDTFDRALELYRKRNFQEALVVFENIDEKVAPKLRQLYLDRCKNFIKIPPKDFDGIYSYTHK